MVAPASMPRTSWSERPFLRTTNKVGPLPAYAVAQLFAYYRIQRDWQLSLKVDNLFDRRYRSFGLLGRNFFPAGTFDAVSAAPEQFAVPGAPRALWLALRYEQR